MKLTKVTELRSGRAGYKWLYFNSIPVFLIFTLELSLLKLPKNCALKQIYSKLYLKIFHMPSTVLGFKVLRVY